MAWLWTDAMEGNEGERRRGVPLGGIQTVGAEHRSKAIEDKKAGERSGGQI